MSQFMFYMPRLEEKLKGWVEVIEGKKLYGVKAVCQLYTMVVVSTKWQRNQQLWWCKIGGSIGR